MLPFQRNLAQEIDGLVEAGRARVVERLGEVTVDNLGVEDAQRLLAVLSQDRWETKVSDEHGSVTSAVLPEDGGPFSFVIRKPDGPFRRILTVAGLTSHLKLSSVAHEGTIATPLMGTGIICGSMRLTSWDDTTPFEADTLKANPRRYVRELESDRIVVGDLGPWIMRDLQADLDLSCPYVDAWRRVAAVRLCHVLADEVAKDGSFTFNGPPVARFESAWAMQPLPGHAFMALQALVRWAYENESEAEARRILVAAEVARRPVTDGQPDKLALGASDALEGARLSYQIGLNKVSADSLKILADLRKAISDETARLSDFTRQIANSVAGAFFTGVAAIALRLANPDQSFPMPWALFAVGVVLMVYIAAVVWTGHKFLSIQRTLRSDWRPRLYKYLGDDQYAKMVEGPARAAERAYNGAAWIALICALLLFVAILMVAFPSIGDAFKGWRSGATEPPAVLISPAAPGRI